MAEEPSPDPGRTSCCLVLLRFGIRAGADGGALGTGVLGNMTLGGISVAPEDVVAAPRRDDGEGRTIRRRRPLPGPRAAVGGFLVAVAVVGTFATVSGAGDDHRVPYVVARHDLAVGDRIDADGLTEARLDVPDFLRARAFRSSRRLVGATVLEIGRASCRERV